VITVTPNKSLQTTGVAAPVSAGLGDWLLAGFVVASFPAPVPELWRLGIICIAV
jgi:hypothetical protein